MICLYLLTKPNRLKAIEEKMPLSRLETILDDTTQSLHIQPLNIYLQSDFDESITIQCSQFFLNKLDKLICQSLEHANYPAACLAFTVIHKCGKNLKLPGGHGFSALITYGLVKKWFEKCRQSWVLGGSLRDEFLLNLAEDFFDALMEVHESGNAGAIQITESFLYPIGHVAIDPRIYILIQKEAIRKFNIILDKSPVELKKDRKMLQSHQAADIMSRLANRILDGGDYDFQTALMEALCRMAPSEQREQLAGRWFTMAHVSTAFAKIRDSEFETDCRKFLNLVNGMKGDKRSVFSYPCLEIYLGKHELLMPSDEKLEEFWIDFNIGSHSISFYFSLPDEEAQEGQWETICINESEVNNYSIKEVGKRKMLTLDLSEVVVVGSVDGSILTIHFSRGLEILPVVQQVFGHSKNVGFVRKTGASVVKTTINVVMDENSATSQIVPESQMSLGDSDKNVASIQMKTPAKMRISESTTYISSSGGGGARSVSTALHAAKYKGKHSLEMVRSAERPGQNSFGGLRTTAKASINITPITVGREGATQQNIPLMKSGTTALSGHNEVEPPLGSTFVPDSQPMTSRNISSKWHKYSVSEMLMMPTQKMCSLPISGSPPILAQRPLCPSYDQKTSARSTGLAHPKQLHVELTRCLPQVLHKTDGTVSPQSVPAQKQKMSDTNKNLINKNTVFESVPHDPKKKRPQKNTRGKGKGQTRSQKDKHYVKAPGKAAEVKMSVSVKSTALSSKEKRDAEVTGKMVKHISSHYEVDSLKGHKISQCLIPPLIDRPFFNMKWHSYMEKINTLVKSNSKNRNTTTRKSNDVFDFNVDIPQSIRRNKAITSSTCISFSDEESRLPSTKKKQPPPKAKRYVKKHLFSDTDTDHGTTDVSWLKESSRKPKPNVTKYPRAAPKTDVVPALPACDFQRLSASPLLSMDKTSVKSTKDIAKPQQKKEKVLLALREVPATTRRSSRAAAHTLKNYREMDSDGNQSENQGGKSEKTSVTEETKSYVERERNNRSKSDSGVKESTFSKSKYDVDESKKEKKLRSKRVLHKKLNEKNMSCQDLKKSSEKQLKPINVLKESVKPKKPTTKNGAPVKEQRGALKEAWAQRQVLSSPLSFIERMRSAENLGPSLDLPCSPILSLQGSPLTSSPNPYVPDPLTPTLLLSKQCSAVTSTKDLKAQKQSKSSVQSIKSVASLTHRSHCKPYAFIRTSAVQSPMQQDLSSQSLALSRPLMTSTLVNQDRVVHSLPPSPLTEALSSRGSQHSFSKLSNVSEASLSHGSTKSSVTGKVTDEVCVALRAEETPQMDECFKSGKDVVSGPNRKRLMTYSSSNNNSDEEDKEQIKISKLRKQHSPRMKPRKLFKSANKAQNPAENWKDQCAETRRASKTKATKKKSTQETEKRRSATYIYEDIHEDTVSSEGGASQLFSHTVVSGHWDADVEDGDMDEDFDTPGLNPQDMCKDFSCKLKQKFKSRFKLVEVYHKQSLKTVQQHISTVNSEVAKQRAQGLEQVQRVLLGEIHKLEQDNTVLKNMENDLTIHWNKQNVAFRSLQKQEKRRNKVLRKTLESNTCHSLVYEEQIFTSQMFLIRKDMKSAQDRLLAEMHEGEIQSVKRGLHTLFFPDATRL